MEYILLNQATKNAIRLKSIGLVLGTPAGEIKNGDVLLWNFGLKTRVIEILRETEKTITIKEKTIGASFVGERKMAKKRLVCILKQ